MLRKLRPVLMACLMAFAGAVFALQPGTQGLPESEFRCTQ